MNTPSIIPRLLSCLLPPWNQKLTCIHPRFPIVSYLVEVLVFASRFHPAVA